MNTKRIYLAVVITIVIPIVLNFILQIKTGFNIIGGDVSPTEWLLFLGTYLAALGSFFLGWISYTINKNAIKQNDKILHNNGWEHLVKRYDHIEEFVVNSRYAKGNEIRILRFNV